MTNVRFEDTHVSLRIVLVVEVAPGWRPYFPELSAAVSRFATYLARRLPRSSLTLVTYSEMPQVWALESRRGETLRDLEPSTKPGHRLDRALHKANDILARAHAGSRRVLMVLSDGVNDTPVRCLQALARSCWGLPPDYLALVGGFSPVGWDDDVQKQAEENLRALSRPLGVYRRIETPPDMHSAPDFAGTLTGWVDALALSQVLTFTLDSVIGSGPLHLKQEESVLPARIDVTWDGSGTENTVPWVMALELACLLLGISAVLAMVRCSTRRRLREKSGVLRELCSHEGFRIAAGTGFAVLSAVLGAHIAWMLVRSSRNPLSVRSVHLVRYVIPAACEGKGPIQEASNQVRAVREDLDAVLAQLGCNKRYIGTTELHDVMTFLAPLIAHPPRERLAMYLPQIRQLLKQYRVPSPLAYLPWVESRFDPAAVSRAGAKGLWQFMSRTFAAHARNPGEGSEDRRLDWVVETEAAARHLRRLLDADADAQWDPLLAVAAYNCGIDPLLEDIGRYRSSHANLEAPNVDESLFWRLRRSGVLPEETAEYVPRFLAAAVYFSFPHHYLASQEDDQP